MASVINFFKAALIPSVKAQEDAANPQEVLKVIFFPKKSCSSFIFCYDLLRLCFFFCSILMLLFRNIFFTIMFFLLLQEKCAEVPKIAAYYEKLQTCNDRVNSRTKTEETCAEELFDYMDALNNCVAQTLFSKLK